MPDTSRRYMSKRNRACDSCRARKAACRIDRAAPCYLCTLHGRECTFLHPTSRLRRSPNKQAHTDGAQESGSTAQSEAEFSNVMGDSIQYETLMPTGSTETSHGLRAAPVGHESFFEGVGGNIHADLGQGIWQTGFSPGSFFSASLNMPLEAHPEAGDSSYPPNDAFLPVASPGEDAAVSLDTQGALTPYLLGSSGDMDPSLLERYRYDAQGTFQFKNLNIHSVTAIPSPVQFLLSEQSIFAAGREEIGCEEVSFRDLRQELEILVPRDIGLRLIDLYQRIIAPQYPILGSQDQPDLSNSPPYILASIYLIVEPFTKFDDKLCVDLAYEKPSGAGLYQIINKALLHEIHAPRLSTVQAMLLLAIRPYPNPIVLESAFKWSQLTSLVACAHALGLHLDPKSWKIPPWQIAQRRYLSYCIYSVDKWLALSLGRPPLLNFDTWLVTSPETDDRLFSGLSSLAWSNIMKRAELDSILDRVLVRLYSPRAINTFSIDHRQIINSAESLLEDLHAWNRTTSATNTDSGLPGQGRSEGLQRVAEMSYHYMHLTICRCILRPFMNSNLNDVVSAEFAIARELSRRKVKDCLLAATGFIQDLQPEDLEMLWPAWSVTAFSSICFQVLLMAVSSLDRSEATEWVVCLHKVRRDMRLRADALPFLRLGLLRIDSIFWKGVSNVLHLEDHVREAFSSGPGSNKPHGLAG